jgi:hypothetical protein
MSSAFCFLLSAFCFLPSAFCFPGTEAYDGNLGRVWAEAEVLATKAEHAKMAIDEYGDAVPD